MSSIPKSSSWILLFKLAQVYETCSIADSSNVFTSFARWVPLTNQQSDTFEKLTALIYRLQLSLDEVSHIS